MSNQIDALHSKAMDIADAAFIAKRKGEHEEAKRLSKESFEYERDAALFLLEKTEIEPTRSILFRSAACLALDAEEYNQASKMISYGLNGNPPNEIKQELDDLLKEIRELQVVEEKSNEEKSDIYNIHFNDGDAVSSGKIALNFFAPLVNSFNELRKAVFHNVSGNELELFVTDTGSFNLFFKPLIINNQTPIFDGIELENRLKEILSYSINIDGLKKLRLNQNELNKLKEFLACIRRNRASINFHFNSLENKKINYSIDVNRADSILKSIEKLDYDYQTNEEYHGYFVALDLKSKKFKFSIGENSVVGGKFSASISDDIKKISFSNCYSINIFKRETKNAGSEKIKPENTLISIHEIASE